MPQLLIDSFGFIGMGFNVLSMQFKKARSIITMQLFGALFFLTNLWLLGATAGALLNIVAAIRAILYVTVPKRNLLISGGIVAAIVACYPICFLVLDKEPTPRNLIVELLPVIAMVVVTVGFHINRADLIRKLNFIGCPLWLVYNLINGAWGGASCEVFTLVSIVVAMIRLRNVEENPKQGV